jgi:hypothetical protein
MTIKTNLNKQNYHHDNVNNDPIEKQILNFISETKIFKKVGYETKQDYQFYILDDEAIIELRFERYGFKLAFKGDKFKLSNKYKSTFDGMKFEADYNRDIKKEFEVYLKSVSYVVSKTKEAQIIADEIVLKKKEYEKKIKLELDEYFANDIIKADFSIYDENLIAEKDEHTPGVWSWLYFRIKGTKQRHNSKHEKSVGVELYMDGTIKNKRIDEFVKAIQCEDYECKPSVREMQTKLGAVADLEDKLKSFNGTKLPNLKKYLSVKKKGYEFRESFNLK